MDSGLLDGPRRRLASLPEYNSGFPEEPTYPAQGQNVTPFVTSCLRR